jgi:hypothetical protein
MIKQKIETDRIGFTDSDIRKSLGKMWGKIECKKDYH